MTEEELERHDSKTLLQLLLSADARCDALTAHYEVLWETNLQIGIERDTFKYRAKTAEAERDRLREAAKHVTGKVLHDIFVQRMGHAYVDDDHTDLTGVNMDGYFNLVQIAEDILAALKGETP